MPLRVMVLSKSLEFPGTLRFLNFVALWFLQLLLVVLAAIFDDLVIQRLQLIPSRTNPPVHDIVQACPQLLHPGLVVH